MCENVEWSGPQSRFDARLTSALRKMGYRERFIYLFIYLFTIYSFIMYQKLGA